MEPASPKRPMTSSLPPFLRFYCSSALYSRQSALTENFGHHQPLLSTTIQSVVAASVFPQNRRFRLGLLAHKRFPGLDPIGQKFRFGIPIKDQWVEVVGVCRDTRYME